MVLKRCRQGSASRLDLGLWCSRRDWASQGGRGHSLSLTVSPERLRKLCASEDSWGPHAEPLNQMSPGFSRKGPGSRKPHNSSTAGHPAPAGWWADSAGENSPKAVPTRLLLTEMSIFRCLLCSPGTSCPLWLPQTFNIVPFTFSLGGGEARKCSQEINQTDSICTKSTELNPRAAQCLVKSQTESKWQRQGSNESLSDSIPVLLPPPLPCPGMS